MNIIWMYIRENKNVIFIVLGQTFVVLLGLSIVYYVVNYIVNLPGFQFDPFLMILVTFLGWQFWKIMDKQNRIIEKQNDLIEHLSYQTSQYPALMGKVESKKGSKKKSI